MNLRKNLDTTYTCINNDLFKNTTSTNNHNNRRYPFNSRGNRIRSFRNFTPSTNAKNIYSNKYRYK